MGDLILEWVISFLDGRSLKIIPDERLAILILDGRSPNTDQHAGCGFGLWATEKKTPRETTKCEPDAK
jgi:hypothetical protein